MRYTFKLLPWDADLIQDPESWFGSDYYDAEDLVHNRLVIELLAQTSRRQCRINLWLIEPEPDGPYFDLGSAIAGLDACTRTSIAEDFASKDLVRAALIRFKEGAGLQVEVFHLTTTIPALYDKLLEAGII
jgi:hypothetical protein